MTIWIQSALTDHRHFQLVYFLHSANVKVVLSAGYQLYLLYLQTVITEVADKSSTFLQRHGESFDPYRSVAVLQVDAAKLKLQD